ncbi:MAG TPA: nucleoside-triphosphatase, partial [Myxococcales bacterium]|nr:nucleoside-triphosphatase [Myxococcales bacterium]
MSALTDRVVAGDVRAAARLMRLIEDGQPEAEGALRELWPRTGRAQMVGITGNPGAGKSTLVDRLVAHLRAMGRTVGVLAVDPTSPFTGGAILGDRIRMQRHALDDKVFIRSMGARGHLGGLSLSTREAIR